MSLLSIFIRNLIRRLLRPAMPALLGATLRDELGVSNADCAVFTGGFEASTLLRTLSLEQGKQGPEAGGVLVLTTPNVASLFRRLRLLLGIQPVYRYHVREYTMSEVLALLREAGFEVVKAHSSIFNSKRFNTY